MAGILTMNEANPIRADSLEVNEADDGLVVFDPAHDMVHHLNPSASVIFDLSDGTRDVPTIVSAVAAAFELDFLPAQETRAGLQELVQRRLILWDGQGESA